MALQRVFNGVTLDLPAEWEDRSVYTFVGPEQVVDANLPVVMKESGFHPNVVVTRQSKADSPGLSDHVASQVEALRHQLPRFEMLSHVESTISGSPAFSTTFTFVAPQPREVTVQQLIVLTGHSDHYYQFTFTALPIDFATRRAEFEAILRSVSFT